MMPPQGESQCIAIEGPRSTFHHVDGRVYSLERMVGDERGFVVGEWYCFTC